MEFFRRCSFWEITLYFYFFPIFHINSRHTRADIAGKFIGKSATEISNLFNTDKLITISAKKRAAAGIAKDVYIIGDDDHIEIWDAGAYEEAMSGFSLDDFLE